MRLISCFACLALVSACGDGSIDVIPPLDPQPQPGELSWSVAIPRTIQSGIAIGSDETIYFTEAGDRTTGRLHALDEHGSELWSTELATLANEIDHPSRPAIARDGRIFVAQSEGSLHVVSSGGELERTIVAPDIRASLYEARGVRLSVPAPAPAIDADGKAIFQSTIGTDASLEVKWSYAGPTNGSCMTVALRGDRVVHAGPNGLIAFDATGEIAWETEPRSDELGCAGIAAIDQRRLVAGACRAQEKICEGLVSIAIDDGRFAGFYAFPEPLSRIDAIVIGEGARIAVFGARVRAADEEIVFASFDAASGALEQLAVLDVDQVREAAFGDDGAIYVADGESVAAIDATGTMLWRFQPSGGLIGSAPIMLHPNGCLLLDAVSEATNERTISCVRTSAHGLAPSAWPHVRGDSAAAMRPALVDR